MKIDVFRVPQSAPDDVSGLAALVERGDIDPANIVAIMGKTEGNGCVNDFTRGFAVVALKAYLRPLIGEAVDRIVTVMSGGTEGVLSPHQTIFTKTTTIDAEAPATPRLALGVHHTRAFAADEIGTLAMVELVAAGVAAAMSEAGLSVADVHFVQIKCPLITTVDTSETASAGADGSYKSMAYSRAASALGVAVALGELQLDRLSKADICGDYELYSTVASTSAGVELDNCEILVLGNSANSHSAYRIGHSVMEHGLDSGAVHRAIEASGAIAASDIVNVFAKAEASPTGEILGRRHTMLDDSDISHTRMARAVVGSVVAAAVQDPMVYVSGGAEHQGPPGGGPIAVIARAR